MRRTAAICVRTDHDHVSGLTLCGKRRLPLTLRSQGGATPQDHDIESRNLASQSPASNRVNQMSDPAPCRCRAPSWLRHRSRIQKTFMCSICPAWLFDTLRLDSRLECFRKSTSFPTEYAKGFRRIACALSGCENRSQYPSSRCRISLYRASYECAAAIQLRFCLTYEPKLIYGLADVLFVQGPSCPLRKIKQF
jgi:hypothetical protein